MSRDGRRGDASSEDTRVGYARPPKEHRFKKGQVSNPHGCKGKLKPEIAFLDETQAVLIAGRRQRLTKRELLLHRLFKSSLAGNVSAIKLLLDDDRKRQASHQNSSFQETLSPEDKAAFDRLIERQARELQYSHTQGESDLVDEENTEESVQ